MGKMSRKGYDQGDMSPVVENCAMPEKDFSQSPFGKTTEYIERQNKQQSNNASQLRKQDWKGRYE